MNCPLLSIIIPVYNVEKYIDECLQSVLAQTFTNYEVLLIDDGSTDQSGKICDAYSEQDSRFITIHKENGGVSSARNTALEICCGKYLTMLDPDDSIAADTYENVIFMESHPEIDILQFPYINCYKNGKQEKLIFPPRIIQGKEAIIMNWWEGNILHFANLNKIFKRFIFEDIRYRENHTSEDTYLIADFIRKANQVYLSDCGAYLYKIHDGSLSSAQTFEKHIDLFTANFRTYKTLVQYPASLSIRVKAFTRVFRRLITAHLTDPDIQIEKYINALKPYTPTWKEIAANKDPQITHWIIPVKLLGLPLFIKLFSWYLSKTKLFYFLRIFSQIR